VWVGCWPCLGAAQDSLITRPNSQRKGNTSWLNRIHSDLACRLASSVHTNSTNLRHDNTHTHDLTRPGRTILSLEIAVYSYSYPALLVHNLPSQLSRHGARSAEDHPFARPGAACAGPSVRGGAKLTRIEPYGGRGRVVEFAAGWRDRARRCPVASPARGAWEWRQHVQGSHPFLRSGHWQGAARPLLLGDRLGSVPVEKLARGGTARVARTRRQSCSLESINGSMVPAEADAGKHTAPGSETAGTA
jgi:hypothetical protein